MAPSCIAVDQAGDKAQPVVGNTNTGNFAQPHVDGDETKRSVGAPRTNDRDKDGHGQENPKPRSLNEHFQFSPEDSVPKKKKKNNNFMKRGPTALTKNRGTGFEGRCPVVISAADILLTMPLQTSIATRP
jgi:hypothetical protein